MSGAGQGLGKAIALKLLDAGCRVALTDTTQANAQLAVAESGAGADRSNTTGGAPNANIRNGFLFNPDRVDYVEGSIEAVPGAAFAGSRSPVAAFVA